jgi:osmotically-inducible protein OsmY
MNRLIEKTLVAGLMPVGVAGCNVSTAEKSVTSSDGAVLLSGNLASADEMRRATTCVNMVPGVKGVENDLVVR